MMDKETRAKVRAALKPFRPFCFYYKEECFLLRFNPRKGVCSQCGTTEKRTELHHLKYDDDHPLENTIELCDTCHGKITYNTTLAIIPMERVLEIRKRTGKIVARHKELK